MNPIQSEKKKDALAQVEQAKNQVRYALYRFIPVLIADLGLLALRGGFMHSSIISHLPHSLNNYYKALQITAVIVTLLFAADFYLLASERKEAERKLKEIESSEIPLRPAQVAETKV